MKKVFIVMLLVLAFVVPMFAQGGQEAKKAEIDKTAPVTIVFWTHEDAARQKLEDQWMKEFMEAHPNVTIEVARYNAEGLRQNMQTADDGVSQKVTINSGSARLLFRGASVKQGNMFNHSLCNISGCHFLFLLSVSSRFVTFVLAPLTRDCHRSYPVSLILPPTRFEGIKNLSSCLTRGCRDLP